MKILHTSDWHLGQTFYGYDRSEEQMSFLKSIAGIVEREKPDAMIVSGDVFHNSAPSAAAMKMYVDGMLAICRACPEMTVVVIAGNHDSASRLEADGELWIRFNVHVAGSVYRDADGIADFRRQVVPVERNGRLLGYIAAVPYCSPRNFPPVRQEVEEMSGDSGLCRQSAYFKGLDDYVRGLGDGVPSVLSAHLAVAGSDVRGHDDIVGGMDYVSLDLLGSSYAYVALGHIHCPQTLPGGRARYCGSPLAVNFDEDYRHSVSLVEAAAGEKPVIRTVEICSPVPLITISSAKVSVPAVPASQGYSGRSPEAESSQSEFSRSESPHSESSPGTFDDALEGLRSFPDDVPAYVRLKVSLSGALPPDCEVRASDLTKDKKCRFCCVLAVRAETDGSADKENGRLTVQEMRTMDPMEIARRYYRMTRNEEMPEDLCGMFREVQTMLAEEERREEI